MVDMMAARTSDLPQAAGPSVHLGRIVIAALTYNRPAGLATLLDGLAALTFSGPVPDLAVAIVDNSPEGNARHQVETRAAAFPWPLHYVHQAERGIAHARNRALTAAADLGADWMAFIDDDEYPDPNWLDRMASMAETSGATAVVGSVKADFEAPPQPWMVAGGFFSIDRYAEGAELDFGNTSNVLFDFRFVQHHGIRFDLAFSLTGGEDTLFFEDVQKQGGRIVFCRSGVVHETIVPNRARFGWLVSRWIRSGNTDGRILMRARPGLKTRLVATFGGGLVRFAVGGGMALLTAPLALFGRTHLPAEHCRVASRGLGFMMSAFGSTIEEYKVVTR